MSSNRIEGVVVDQSRIAEIQSECPNVGVDMIRRVLKNLRAEKQVECLGRGQSARWRKTGQWQLGNNE